MADSDVRRILSAEDQKRAEMVDGAAFLYSVDSSTFKAKNPEEDKPRRPIGFIQPDNDEN